MGINRRTFLEFEGERLVLTHPCKCCGAEIEIAELCEKCAKRNDPFKTADNCGHDLR